MQTESPRGIGWRRDRPVFEWEHSLVQMATTRRSIAFRSLSEKGLRAEAG